MAEQYACQQFLNDDIIIFIINTNFFFFNDYIMQLLEATPDAHTLRFTYFATRQQHSRTTRKAGSACFHGKIQKGAPNSLTGETPFRRRCGEIL